MFEKHLQEIKNGINLRATLIEMRAMLKEEGAVKIIKSETDYSLSLFPALLKNDDAKVRKNAALIMGMLSEAEYADALMEAYTRENTLFVKSAYLEALSSYDFSPYKEVLLTRKKQLSDGDFDNGDIKHIAAELKQLSAMFPEGAGANHRFRNPTSPVNVILTTGKDTIDTLYDAVHKAGITHDTKKVFCGVNIYTTDISSLAKIRIYREMLFTVNNMKSSPKAQLPAAIAGGNLTELLELMYDDADRPFRFRITSTENVSKIASELQVLSKGRLINSPSDYEIELKLMASKNGGFGVLLKLHTYKDNRFKYRINHVAASMKPANAAMMVYLAKDYLKEGARILDPFCGVGTILIERNKLVKASHIYGIDIFGDAIIKARENTDKAGNMKINYINRNYFDFTHEYKFDEIITEMPVVDKEEADDFYTRFFDKSVELLNDDGVIIMLSKEKKHIKKKMRLTDAYKLLREFTFSERDDISVFVIGRKTGDGLYAGT